MSSATLSFLLYHIVFGVKNRDFRLGSDLRLRMFPYMGGIIKNLGGIPIIINGRTDHVHILCFLPRHISLSEAVKVIKAKSSLWHNRVWDKNSHPLHWQDGYGIFTVSADSLESVKNYIVEQDEHHLKRSFDEEWALLHDKLIQYKDLASAMECAPVEE